MLAQHGTRPNDMHRTRWTFCFPVAIGFLSRAKSLGRYLLGLRRSAGLRGKVLHAEAIRIRGDELVMIDYIPRKRKSTFTDPEGDSSLAFKGIYRLRRYRLESSGTGDTFIAMARDCWRRP